MYIHSAFFLSFFSSFFFFGFLKTVFIRIYHNLFSKLLWYCFITVQAISVMMKNVAREGPKTSIADAPYRCSGVVCKVASWYSWTTLWVMVIWRCSDMCLQMVCPSQYCIMLASKRPRMSWLELDLYGEDFLVCITV